MQQTGANKENRLVFLFCLAALAGPALSALFDGSDKQFPDAESYLGLAEGNFDQTTVRRYRVIVPFIAALLDKLTVGMFENLRPAHYSGEFSLRFCFLLTNLLLMAAFCTLVYRYCRSFGYNRSAAFIGTLAVITSRYTVYFAALPLIDSLISVAVAMVLVGLKTGNKKMLVFAIFLGPLARESFIFIAPLIVFFSRIPVGRQIAYFAASGLIAWSVRLLLDYFYPPTTAFWLNADVSHVHNIVSNVPMLFSAYGLYKIAVNMGLWILIPISAYLVKRDFLRGVFKTQRACIIAFLISILLQMLLSGSMERMFYPALLLFAVIVAGGTAVLLARVHPDKQ